MQTCPICNLFPLIVLCCPCFSTTRNGKIPGRLIIQATSACLGQKESQSHGQCLVQSDGIVLEADKSSQQGNMLSEIYLGWTKLTEILQRGIGAVLKSIPNSVITINMSSGKLRTPWRGVKTNSTHVPIHNVCVIYTSTYCTAGLSWCQSSIRHFTLSSIQELNDNLNRS